jgi:GNAT superfamily N-acetyltransferase
MMNISQMQPGKDEPAVESLFREYLEWAARRLDREYGIFIDVDEYLLRSMVELPKTSPPSGRTLIARWDERVAGVACMREIGPSLGEIKRMYVRPSFRKMGIGQALLDTVIAEARLIGFERLRLDSTRFMAGAHRLYRAAGFQEIEPYLESEIPAKYHEYWVFMEKQLCTMINVQTPS